MADEVMPVKSEPADNTAETTTPDTGKESNKSFSQSEHDRAVAEAIKKEREKLTTESKQKSELEQQLNQLLKEKEEAELAEKSELEKAQFEMNKLKEELDKLNAEKESLTKAQMRSELLSDPRYSGMPKAYKNMIQGATKEDMESAAEEALKEYQADFGVTGKSFGEPKETPKKAVPGAFTQNDLKSAIMAKLGKK